MENAAVYVISYAQAAVIKTGASWGVVLATVYVVFNSSSNIDSDNYDYQLRGK